MSELHLQSGDRLWAETDRIDVTSNLPRPDPRWTYTDHQGHEHYRDDDGRPTLSWMIDETYWCDDCGDEHTEGHYECPLCGEHITPGTVGPSLYREYIPGMTHYYLNDTEISPDEYRRLSGEVASP